MLSVDRKYSMRDEFVSCDVIYCACTSRCKMWKVQSFLGLQLTLHRVHF